MGDRLECPSTYETYIDLYQNRHVKDVIWRFFRKMKDSESAKCTKCKKEISYGQNTNLLIEHLKIEHYYQEDIGVKVLYQVYLEHLSELLNERPSDFPKTDPKHLRISFGIKVDDGFTLIRFPKSRIGRTIYQEKSIYKSDWQRTVCKEYLENPVGSYQGHFDRPITCKVYMGSRPLSFSEYTNFTHTQGCNEYIIDKARYEKIDDLQKIKAFAASDLKEKLVVSGPCSRDNDQRVLYTCTKHECIYPCPCKDCIEEEAQCEDHDILHPGFFDPDRHAVTVRMHDSHNINLVRDDFSFDAGRIVEVIKYAGIEKHPSNCVKCPRDLLHHQAYHFVHHSCCKFCENENHKYEDVVSKTACETNMKETNRLERYSCHFCNKLFESFQSKNNHIQSQHCKDTNNGIQCNECKRTFQSYQALQYHKKVIHTDQQEEHQCPSCDKIFNTKHGLNCHKRSVHGQRKFDCHKCSFKFKRQSNLNRHCKLVHEIDFKKCYQEDLDLHNCNQCDFKTIYKENLKGHIEKVHCLTKLFFSCQKCSFKTTYKRNLTSHARIHLDPIEMKTIHQCDVCEFTSLYERSLKRHKKEKHAGTVKK